MTTPNQYDRSTGKKCVEREGPVGSTIGTIIKEDCEKLRGFLSDLTEAEQNHQGLRRIQASKKCWLIKTEKNHQIFRNLELGVGVELIQATLEIKTDVDAHIKLGAALADTLKKLVAAIKDAKQKFKELEKAGCDLESCMKDKCSCTQMTILTGKPPEKCDDKEKPRTAACDAAEMILGWLVHRPETFVHEIDISLGAAADVAGIQTFMNIESLKKFQESMSTSAVAFEGLVKEKMTKSAEDLKAVQTDLEKFIVEHTKIDYLLYRKRNLADAEKETIEYLCCHKCECIVISEDPNNPDRLKKCREWICNICTTVDDIYCHFPGGQEGGQGHEHEHDNSHAS